MSDSTVHNLLRGTCSTVDNSEYGVVSYKLVEPLVVGRKYTVSGYVEELVRMPLPSGVDRPVLALYDGCGWWSAGNLSGDVPGVLTLTFTYKQPFQDHADPSTIWLFNTPQMGTGVKRRARLRDVMLVEGTEPAAWAPAEGEEIAGGGVSMSANLLSGLAITENANTVAQGDGTYLCKSRTDTGTGYIDVMGVNLKTDVFTANQTVHLAVSLRGKSGTVEKNQLWMYVRYVDSAGHRNFTGRVLSSEMTVTASTGWTRFELSAVIPSGMYIDRFAISDYGRNAEFYATSPCLSYGGPVTLAYEPVSIWRTVLPVGTVLAMASDAAPALTGTWTRLTAWHVPMTGKTLYLYQRTK